MYIRQGNGTLYTIPYYEHPRHGRTRGRNIFENCQSVIHSACIQLYYLFALVIAANAVTAAVATAIALLLKGGLYISIY